MELSTTANLVKEILTEKPETRDDDYLLWVETIQRTTEGKIDYSMSFVTFLYTAKFLGIPQFETVSRARRKVQEQHPELKGKGKVRKARADREVDFKDFARNFVC